jgi:hypothetical protein
VNTGRDGPLRQPLKIDPPKVIGITVIHGHAESQIEIAVIQSAVPIDAELVATHEMGERRWIKGILQKLQVGIHLSGGLELLAITADGHVRENE